MSEQKQTSASSGNQGPPNGTEKDPDQDEGKQVADLASEPEAKVEEETEQTLYEDRNPNWTEKDLPRRDDG